MKTFIEWLETIQESQTQQMLRNAQDRSNRMDGGNTYAGIEDRKAERAAKYANSPAAARRV